MAVMRQLDESQWWSPDALREQQNRQIAALVEHAYLTVPYYREQWRPLGGAPDPGSDRWLDVPVLTREELQRAGHALVSTAIPKAHGKTRVIRTSGSLGIPVKALDTDVTRFMWDVFTMRDHLWHKRDTGGKLAILRFLPDGKALYPQAMELDGWACVVGEVFETGPARLLNIRSHIEDVAEWLTAENPEYLLCYPTMVKELLGCGGDVGLALPALREVRTISEMVAPDLQKGCEEAWGAKLVDLYSTIEAGYIALQCPEHACYHIQSENVLVEILDDEGQPCRPGETGRVVVTSLHNYATPLIRYEIGDLAVVGEPCRCGRGLPVIERVLGRYRNFLTLPDGRRIYPEFSHHRYSAPVRQIQMIQTGRESITVKLVMAREMTSMEVRGMTELIHERLKHPFRLTFQYVNELRRSDNGKVEEFISEL
jgi:phenylacetate-CoA ligase